MSTTTTSTHVGTVSDLYGAFGRGDVPFILDHFADDISWEEGLRFTEMPWFQRRTGKQQVAEFFQVLNQGVALSTFDPQMIVGDGDTVISVIRIAGSIVSNGNPVEEDLWVHLWKFRADGKVASFRHIADLAREEIPFKN
jgi:ketosteroid isomerase-like protein